MNSNLISEGFYFGGFHTASVKTAVDSLDYALFDIKSYNVHFVDLKW